MDIINIDISDKLSFCKDRNLDHDLRRNDSLDLVCMYSRTTGNPNAVLASRKN